MLKKIRVLLIEDNEDAALLEKSILERYEKINFEVIHVISLKESLKVIGKKFFDVILLDLVLPNGEGLEVFNSIHNKCDDVPIVIVSGYEEHALDAVQAGAQDYLIKPIDITHLITSINYSIERKKVEEKNKKDYKKLLSIFDSMDEMIYISEPYTHEILYMNESIKKIFGCSIGQKCYKIFANNDLPCNNCHEEEIFGPNIGKTFTYEVKSGRNNRWYSSTIRAIKWPNGRMLKYTISIDITKSKIKEEKLSKFIEKKIDSFNIEVSNSAEYYQKQIHRLEKVTLNLVSNGA